MGRDGLIERTIYAEVPARVEYTLTSLGATLRELVRGLVEWSGLNVRRSVERGRARIERGPIGGDAAPRLAQGGCRRVARRIPIGGLQPPAPVRGWHL
jgi:hypothetical protein